jgi:hypothetical protein
MAGGPHNLDAIRFGRRPQPEVRPKVILRNVACATVNFVCLRHPTCNYLQPGSNRKPVALRASKLEPYPMVSGYSEIADDLRRAVNILFNGIHLPIIQQVTYRKPREARACVMTGPAKRVALQKVPLFLLRKMYFGSR